MNAFHDKEKQMPFKVQTFQENVDQALDRPTRDKLDQACDEYRTLTSSTKKLRSIRGMMDILDREVNEATRREIMQACGTCCIGASTLQKAQHLHDESLNLDDFLDRLNEAHIGGGHLEREGEVIYAAYGRCYCGSVSISKELFSDTYCHCSCGWYQKLFETLFKQPVEVELMSSIIQGSDRCRFIINIPANVS